MGAVMSVMLGAEFDRLHTLTGVKWTDDPRPGHIPSWVADMDFEVAAEIKAAMQAVLDRGDTGYNFDAKGKLPGAWADWQEKHFGWRPPEDEITVFTATLNCLNLVMEFMTEPGDGVVVFTPIYYPFRAITEDSGRRIVDVPLDGPDWRFDPERFEAAIDSGTKLVLFCNPHNPLGRMFDREELTAFAEVVERRDLMVISDEIWADLTFDGDHIPMWDQFPAIRERVITLGSASKTFNLAGMRTAIAHIGDPRVRDRFAKLSQHFIAGPNTFGAEASLAAWTHGQPWLDRTRKQLQTNRDHLVKRVRADLPGATITPPEATYLAWVDFADTPLGESSTGERPANLLRAQANIGVHDGYKFCQGSGSCVRINFATSPAILDELIDRMAAAMQSHQ